MEAEAQKNAIQIAKQQLQEDTEKKEAAAAKKEQELREKAKQIALEKFKQQKEAKK